MRNFKSPKLGFIFLFVLLAIWGCSTKGINWHKIERKALTVTQFYEIPFNLIPAGNDSLEIEGVVAVDSNTVYRLKSERHGITSEIYSSIAGVPGQLYLDSSVDRGVSWSTNIPVLKLYQNFFGEDKVIGFYISDDKKTKYILTKAQVYVASNNSNDFVPLNSTVITIGDHFYNARKDVLTFMSTVPLNSNSFLAPKTLWFNQVRKTTLSSNIIDTITSTDLYYLTDGRYVLSNDTIYTTDTVNNKMFLFRKNAKGIKIDSIDLQNIIPKFETIRLFVNGNNLSFYSNGLSAFYVSHNSGSSWTKLEFPDLVYPKFYRADNIIVSLNGNLPMSSAMNEFYCIDLDRHSWTLVKKQKSGKNETIFLSSSPNFILIKADSFRRSNTIFFATRKELEPNSIPNEIKAYSISELAGNIIVKVRFENIHRKKLTIELYGANTFQYLENKKLKLLSQSFSTDTDSIIWTTTFKASDINLHKDEDYKLNIVIADDILKATLDVNDTYLQETFFKKYKSQLVNASIFISVLFFIILSLMIVYFVHPYFIYKIFDTFRKIRQRMGKFHFVVELSETLLFIPFFVMSKRVGDAWLLKNCRKISDAFLLEPTVVSHSNYVSMRLTTGSDVLKVIDVNSLQSLQRFFRDDVTCIEIIGKGGMGKTTLAIQLGRWAIEELHNHKMDFNLGLPVFIEEEAFSVYDVIERKINACTKNRVQPEFLVYLVQNKRLMIIVDSLSEKSMAMQRMIATSYGAIKVNNLVITSRTEISLEARKVHFLYPEYISSQKVFEFINERISREELKVFSSDANRASLFQKILAIFEFDDKKVPISPILVVLMIEKAIDLAKREEYGNNIELLLKSMPSLIPDIFSDYLGRVNPKKMADDISDDTIYKSCEIIADLSMNREFIPKDVPVYDVEAALLQIFPDPKIIIYRLIENGILVKRRYANDNFIRFILDPIAEYLAAMSKAKKCNKSRELWLELYELARGTNRSFEEILKIIHISYADKHDWWVPDWELCPINSYFNKGQSS